MVPVINEIKVGIIGGGQLGKMMVLEGKKWGLYFTILDPTIDCPASSIVDEHILGDFYDVERIRELADKSDILTYEFEHINADSLIELEKEGYRIYPSPKTLKIIQDKLQQKTFLKENNIPVPSFQKIERIEDLYDAAKTYGFPLLLKSCRGGYDGKGNFKIETSDDIPKAYEFLGGENRELMVEAFVPFIMEVSAIVARGIQGEMKIYPIGENIHKDNILNTTIVPARVSMEVEEKAKELAFKTMEVLEGVGIFCIEMFVDVKGKVLVNEIAPRTHNSGHYTIEGCSTSQFAQHLRGILGMPLGSTELLKPCVMINVLGEDNYKGKAKIVGVEEALKMPEVFVHYYGKTLTAPRRKMGHVTVLASAIEEALNKAEQVRKTIKVISHEEEESYE